MFYDRDPLDATNPLTRIDLATNTFSFNAATGQLNYSFSVVPEPSNLAFGLLVTAGALRRRRTQGAN